MIPGEGNELAKHQELAEMLETFSALGVQKKLEPLLFRKYMQ